MIWAPLLVPVGGSRDQIAAAAAKMRFAIASISHCRPGRWLPPDVLMAPPAGLASPAPASRCRRGPAGRRWLRPARRGIDFGRGQGRLRDVAWQLCTLSPPCHSWLCRRWPPVVGRWRCVVSAIAAADTCKEANESKQDSITA